MSACETIITKGPSERELNIAIGFQIISLYGNISHMAQVTGPKDGLIAFPRYTGAASHRFRSKIKNRARGNLPLVVEPIEVQSL